MSGETINGFVLITFDCIGMFRKAYCKVVAPSCKSAVYCIDTKRIFKRMSEGGFRKCCKFCKEEIVNLVICEVVHRREKDTGCDGADSLLILQFCGRHPFALPEGGEFFY